MCVYKGEGGVRVEEAGAGEAQLTKYTSSPPLLFIMSTNTVTRPYFRPTPLLTHS